MRLTLANHKAVEYSCKNFHYSKCAPAVQYAFNVYNDKEEWCGCILYGGGANNDMPKSFGLKSGEVLELVRVALNGKQEQTSKAIALSLKLLHKIDPLVKMIVSYADHRQNHVGTIYKATNWLYLGIAEIGGFQYYYKGKWIHPRTMSELPNRAELRAKLPKRQLSNKFKYIYIYSKELRKEYEKIAKPYPTKDDITTK